MSNERQERRRVDAIFYRGLTLWDGFWNAGKGRLQQPKYEKAIHFFKKAAEEGHSRAQYYLGIAYMHALGVPRDNHKAVHWFRKSADQDHADAQCYLGIAYMHALGVPRDDHEAVHWFRKSADQDHAGAQNNLGIMYSEGWGVDQKDEKEADKFFCRAKKNGNEDATVNLGVMYLQKSEMTDSAKEKRQWLDKSKKLLCPYKESNARSRYYYFRTLQEESEELKEWTNKAEDLGNMAAVRMELYGNEDYEEADAIFDHNRRYPLQSYYFENDEIEIPDYGPEAEEYEAQAFYYAIASDDFHKFIEDPWDLEHYEKFLISKGSYPYGRKDEPEIAQRWKKLEDSWRSKDSSTDKNDEQGGLPNVRKWLKSGSFNEDDDYKLEDWRKLIDPKAATMEQFFNNRLKLITNRVVDAEYSKDVKYWKQGLNHLEQLLSNLCTCGKSDAVYEYYYALVLLFSGEIREAENWLKKAVVSSKDSDKVDLYHKNLYWLSLLYHCEVDDLGITKEKALDKVNRYIRNAAEGGFAEAQYEIGLMYNSGIDGENKPMEAERWFLRAAEQGRHFRAAYQLGFMYLHGKDGMSRNYRKAEHRFKQALPKSVAKWKKDNKVEFGNLFSENFDLGYVYKNAKYNDEDIYKEIIFAMFNLVIIYLCGDSDVVRDCKKAKEWFCRAIMLGDKLIEYINKYDSEKMKIKKKVRSEGIAMILQFLKGIDDKIVHEDARKLLGDHKRDALEWILDGIVGATDEKLCEEVRDLLRQHIDPMSFAHLLLEDYERLRRLVAPHVDEANAYRYWYALSFLFGNNILKAHESFQKTDELFQKAIDDGEDNDENGFRPMIGFWLGCMYLRDDIISITGLEKEKAFEKAKMYFERAANEGGLPEAQYEIGLMYLDDIGRGKEPKKAETWFCRAAEQGCFRAVYQLGLMYFHGQGEVERNYSEAKHQFEEMNPYQKNRTRKLDLAAFGHIAKDLYKESRARAKHIAQSVIDVERTSAMFHLAFIFLHDRDIDRNFRNTKNYFEEAARYSDRFDYWDKVIEGIGLFLKEDMNMCKRTLMELLEWSVFNNRNEKVNALQWLLLAAEDPMGNKARELLVQHVDFLEKNSDSKDVRKPQRIEWLLKAAAAGADEIQKTARELLSRHIDSIEEFVWDRIWGWLATPEWKDAQKQQKRLHMLLHPHIDVDIGGEAAAYQYYYALSFLFSHDIPEAKKWLDQAFDLTEKLSNENALRQKILYWLGHICFRNDEIEDARRYFADAGKKVNKTGSQGKDGDSRSSAATTSGLAEAQYEVGLMYLEGIGGEKERGEAKKWFNSVNEQKCHPYVSHRDVSHRATYQLGLMNLQEENWLQAKECFKKMFPEELVAKYDPDTSSIFNLNALGLIYKTRAWGFPILPERLKDAVGMKFEDVVWREQADALANLGFIDLRLNGGNSEVEDYFTKAADACHSDAMFNLGLMSLKNNDSTKAIEWFEKAWEGDLECDECGPKGRFEHVKESSIKENSNAAPEIQKLLHEIGPGRTSHTWGRNNKIEEKLYSCNYEYAQKIQKSDDWWPRYRGNWLALHYLAILYSERSDKDDAEKAERCIEKLQMTGFTMPEYARREISERMKATGTAEHS